MVDQPYTIVANSTGATHTHSLTHSLTPSPRIHFSIQT